MYSNPHPGEAREEGLGFWAALIPIGISAVGSAFDGGADIDTKDYYRSAKSVIFCPDRGEDPNLVGAAIANIDASSQGGRLRQTIVTNLATDPNWAKYSVAPPRTASQQAHVLINGGNGWRYCGRGEAIGPKDVVQRDIVEEILAYDAERRTLQARARAAGTTAAGALESLAATEIVPGVSTPLLALGGLALVLVLRRR